MVKGFCLLLDLVGSAGTTKLICDLGQAGGGPVK
jgi:hypothetical protein